MEYITTGREFGPDKIRSIYYNPSENFKELSMVQERFILVFIKEGILSANVQHKKLIMSAPCMLCLNEKESFELIETQNVSATSIYFHPKFISSNLSLNNIYNDASEDFADLHDRFLLLPFIKRESRYNGILILNPSFVLKMNQLFINTGNELIEQPDWYWSCRSRSYFMEVLILLEKIYSEMKSSRSSMPESIIISKGYDDIEKVLMFLHVNYNSKIKISTLATLTNTNRTTLSKRFKEATGQTIIQYTNNYRIQIAKSLLHNTALSIEEISQRTGINETAYFTQLFKRENGHSPKEYRKKVWD